MHRKELKVTEKKQPIFALAVTGPTASGKTELSLHIAESIGCEIICCDSMQIYKEMDIGTAKPTAEERRRVPHHMTDFLSPSEDFSADAYKEMALRVADDIRMRGKIPLFVGGTGLYIDSVMRNGTSGVPKSDREYCKALEILAKTEEGKHGLWERLRAVDPVSAELIHENNVRRVVRAIEIYEKTGKTKSSLDALANLPDERISVKLITLDFHERENLYERVDKRVDIMMASGLLAEVEALYGKGYLSGENTASQAIGYKELVDCIEGRCTLSEAVENIKLSTRRYAKRQLTWFRHENEKHTVYLDGENRKMRDSGEVIKEALLLARRLNEER